MAEPAGQRTGSAGQAGSRGGKCRPAGGFYQTVQPFVLPAGLVQDGHAYGHKVEVMLEVSVAKARNTFTQLIYEAEGGNVVHITRRGKLVAVLVSREEYDRLESQDSKRDFWQAIEDWRAQAGFDWPELTPEEVDGWRDRRPGREFSWPD